MLGMGRVVPVIYRFTTCQVALVVLPRDIVPSLFGGDKPQIANGRAPTLF